MSRRQEADACTEQARPWYAVYTKHQHEKAAKEYLSGNGIDVLLPLYRTVRRSKERSKVVDLPLFPCYVFIRTSLERRLDILKAPGVFSIVESGGRASEIAANEIDAIVQVTTSSTHVEPHPYLKAGDRVRVRYGALSGIEGILVRFKSQFRVVLNLNLLQKAIAVEVDLATIERVYGSATAPDSLPFEREAALRQAAPSGRALHSGSQRKSDRS